VTRGFTSITPAQPNKDSIGPRPSGQQLGENEPMLYCPVCSTRLTELKCKLVCNKCGYYMSCADYY
jgi:hypothetical protein